MENEELEDLSKKYYQPENYPNVVAPKANLELEPSFILQNMIYKFKNIVKGCVRYIFTSLFCMSKTEDL